MADPLVEYLVELNNDSDKLAKHDADPKKAAQDAGLSEADVKMIADKDYDEIKKRCITAEQSAIILVTFHSS